MARLPEPGGDSGKWGDVLNEYLGVSHDTDGSLKSNIVTTENIQNSSITVAKIATSGAPTDGQTLTYSGSSLTWATSSGSGTVPDASSGTKGIVQLAGDLGGTAASPTVPGLSTKEPAVATGTTNQYYRGDKSWQTLDKSAVGLANVDNTSDANKPVSTATQTAINGKANTSHTHATADITSGTFATARLPQATDTTVGVLQLAGDLGGTASSPTVPGLTNKEPTITAGTTSQYYRGDKAWHTLDKTAVGLGNVDNTSDANKPVSTAMQTALDGKAATNDARFTDQRTPLDNSVSVAKLQDGSVSEPKLNISNTPTSGNILSWDGTDLKWEAPGSAPVSSVSGRTGAITLTKTDVGLGNVDNTSDANKPVSTATQTALNGKANSSHTHAATDIASGTIASARLPQATEATLGGVQLASVIEATTGTDTTKAVTAAGVTAAVNAVSHPILFVDSLGDIPPGTPVDTLVIVRAA